MSTISKTRRAHELLDRLGSLTALSKEQEELLRSFLPEMPKQKTLEEIHEEVESAACSVTDSYWSPSLNPQDWLWELHAQLKGLKDAPATEPALPAGMRLADHKEHGRVVVSPTTDEYDDHRIFYLNPCDETGAKSRWASVNSLTFIDAAPAAPAHPEFLETEADYASAPVGTVVAKDNQRPAWKPAEHWFINNNPFDNREMAGGLNPAPSRVLRWGLGS